MGRTPRSLPGSVTSSEPSSPTSGHSRAESAYSQIKAAIIDMTLPPGSQTSESQIAARLGMSRTPVHQAIARLEQESWLSLSARSGVKISSPEPDDLAEVYEVLIGLEGTAVSRLASRPRNSDDQIDSALYAACEACEEALAREDLRAWAEADHALHSLWVDECGNKRLTHMARMAIEPAHRAWLLTVGLRPWPSTSNDDHRAIVDAISARTPEKARSHLQAHRERGMNTLLPILSAMTPGGPTFLSESSC